MLKRLSLDDFTLFPQGSIAHFAKGINLVVGDNATGKSHLLKAGYASAWLSYAWGSSMNRPDKQGMQRAFAEKLVGVYKPETLGHLVRRKKGRGRARLGVVFFEGGDSSIEGSFSNLADREVQLETAPVAFLDAPVTFFPTKETLSLFPKFASLYRDYHIELEETYYDLCLALDRPLPRGPRLEEKKKLMGPLEEMLEGPVTLESGRFYLTQAGAGKLEAHLLAEGVRKLATLDYLVANGTLTNNSILFWDEPESNLNPKLVRKLAMMLCVVAEAGTQVILATHSLFLIREFELLFTDPRWSKLERHYIGLTRKMQEGIAGIENANSFEDLDIVTALEEELSQFRQFENLQ